jgi:mono/diheme cytochrome c family protein
MSKPFLVAAVIVVFGVPLLCQQAQAPNAAPAVAPTQVNPIHPTPQSQARAKQIYGFDCAMCHGVNGDGKGDMNADGKMKMLDYRDPASLKGLSDGEIYNIIEAGKGDAMPPEDGRAKPDEIWNIVIYLRSFSKSQQAANQ